MHSLYDRKLYQAIFCIMYHAGLRVSEEAVPAQSHHTLQFANVSLDNNRLFLTLKTLKHPKQRNAKMVLLPDKNTNTCAVCIWASIWCHRLSVTSAEIVHKSLSIHKRCMRTTVKVGYQYKDINPDYTGFRGNVIFSESFIYLNICMYNHIFLSCPTKSCPKF